MSRAYIFSKPLTVKGGGITLVVMAVLILVGIGIVSSIALTWGIIALIGALMIITACLMIIFDRQHPDAFILILIFVGFVLLIFHFLGFEIGGSISFEGTPFEFFYNIFH